MELTLLNTIALLFFAGVVDVLFLTGIWFSGTFLFIIAGTLYTSGAADFWLIVPVIFSASLLTNCGNFLLGRHGSHLSLVARYLDKPRAQAWRSRLTFLSGRSLFILMIGARFVGLVRPLYALILGASGISLYRFIQNEIIIAALWTGAWSLLIYLFSTGLIALPSWFN